jgi:hypothetical protein
MYLADKAEMWLILPILEPAHSPETVKCYSNHITLTATEIARTQAVVYTGLSPQIVIRSTTRRCG